MHKIVLLLLVLSWIFSKCTYDNEEDYYVCDTVDVNYTTVVRPLIEDNGCISCHNSTFSNGDIILDSYDNLVQHSDAVLGAIQHLPGFEPMPQGNPMMDECAINKIKAWKNDGFPEN
ncbi:MAG: hypothetical protein GVY19_08690 [Bacteroidetes bacterium]|jgi:hypothetical protein|nr:hypothetical protein [Bacteroidota bacterium]